MTILYYINKKIVSTSDDLLNLETGIVTYINPFGYLQLRKNKIDLKSFDAITSDGIVLKMLYQLFFLHKIKRLSPDFSSYFEPLFKQALDKKRSIYFIGTKPGLIEKAITNIKLKYPDLNIKGYRNGFFKNEDEIRLHIKYLAFLNPDIVIVGMGTPAQEQYLIDLKSSNWTGVGFTCGGFLHQTAESTEYYPSLINKLNLRWMYRIYKEPKLFRRYTIDYFIFLFLYIKDFITLKFKKQ